MKKTWQDLYPNGSAVLAFNDATGKMEPGTITTHTADMRGHGDGLIVRFEDGAWIEYGYSFLDEEDPQSEKSFVQVIK